MKRILGLLLVLLCLSAAIPASAQSNISTTTCPGAGCVTVSTFNQGSVGIQVTGTWVGTLTIQSSLGTASTSTFTSLLVYPSNSTTGVTTSTGNGVWTAAVAGINQVRVVFTAYTSGTAVVTIRPITQARSNPSTGAGGGSGTVTSITTSSPITGGPITDSGAIACGTCGVTGSPLSQFAATTSAQLAGVLTNETGTGLAVFSINPTLEGLYSSAGIYVDGATATIDFFSGDYAAGFSMATDGTITVYGSSLGIGNPVSIASVVSSGAINYGLQVYATSTNSPTEVLQAIRSDSRVNHAIDYAYGNVAIMEVANGASIATKGYGFEAYDQFSGNSTVAEWYGIKASLILNDTSKINGTGWGFYSGISGTSATKTTGTFYHFWGNSLIGAGVAANSYFLWYDGGGGNCDTGGVYRVNEFGIPAYYNPCFTTYTPGLANFERIITRWGDTGVYGTDNIAYIGVEKGGTGTARAVELVGGGLRLNSTMVTPASSGTRYLCISTAGVVTSSASACSGT